MWGQPIIIYFVMYRLVEKYLLSEMAHDCKNKCQTKGQDSSYNVELVHPKIFIFLVHSHIYQPYKVIYPQLMINSGLDLLRDRGRAKIRPS